MSDGVARAPCPRDVMYATLSTSLRWHAHVACPEWGWAHTTQRIVVAELSYRRFVRTLYFRS
eukprot:1013160-Prymnesium_polylepis.1